MAVITFSAWMCLLLPYWIVIHAIRMATILHLYHGDSWSTYDEFRSDHLTRSSYLLKYEAITLRTWNTWRRRSLSPQTPVDFLYCNCIRVSRFQDLISSNSRAWGTLWNSWAGIRRYLDHSSKQWIGSKCPQLLRWPLRSSKYSILSCR